MNRPTPRRRPRGAARGYTVVEMLVTVAAITALIILVIPGIERTRESARSVSCMNNLHRIYEATQTWKSDQIHQDGAGSEPLQADGWRAALAPYIGDMRAYDCPDTTSDSSPDSVARAAERISSAPITAPDGAPPGSTCGPFCLTCQSGMSVLAAPQTSGRVPSDYGLTVNLPQANHKPHDVVGMDYLTETIRTTDEWTKAPYVDPSHTSGAPAFARHNKHVNVVYGDGSVRSVSLERRDLGPTGATPEAAQFWRVD